MGKKLLVLFFMLLLASALEIEKEVSGENILETGEELRVRLSIISEEKQYIIKIKDKIPDAFSAKELTGNCIISAELEGNYVVCPVDSVLDGSSEREYTLVAEERGAGIKIGIGRAEVTYLEPSIQENNNLSEEQKKAYYQVETSDEIKTVYSIGPSSIEVFVIGIKDEEGLPGRKILPGMNGTLDLKIENPGSIDAENVRISILSEILNYEKNITSIPAGASRILSFDISSPPVSQFTEKEETIKIAVSFKGRNEELTEKNISEKVEMVRPKVSFEREVKTYHKKIEGKIETRADIIFMLKNTGGADAKLSLSQSIPAEIIDSENIREKSGRLEIFFTENETEIKNTLPPGKELRATLTIPADELEELPGAELYYKDRLENIYETVSVPSEKIEVRRGLFVLLHEAVVDRVGDRGVMIFALLIPISLYLMSRDKFKALTLPLGVIALISTAIVYAWYII